MTTFDEFLSKAVSDCVNARRPEDAPCKCGHALWLHDDGEGACLDCDCQKAEPKENP